jgi:DNA invertase Pin-like site-specific DNA recombinase
MNEKTTILYVRVSTLDQVGGAESQTRSLTEWC